MADLRRPAIAILLLAVALPASAREEDREAPATIEADRVEVERADGISRYYGDVVFVQGTLRITGDEMMLRSPGGVVRFAETRGQPATVRQETDAGELVDAEAALIEYEAGQQLITLTGDAVMRREGERFAAGRIRYRTDTGRVEAGSSGNEERVRIRIEPEAETDDGGADAGNGQ